MQFRPRHQTREVNVSLYLVSENVVFHSLTPLDSPLKPWADFWELVLLTLRARLFTVLEKGGCLASCGNVHSSSHQGSWGRSIRIWGLGMRPHLKTVINRPVGTRARLLVPLWLTFEVKVSPALRRWSERRETHTHTSTRGWRFLLSSIKRIN